jgi:hypothetical protein
MVVGLVPVFLFRFLGRVAPIVAPVLEDWAQALERSARDVRLAAEDEFRFFAEQITGYSGTVTETLGRLFPSRSMLVVYVVWTGLVSSLLVFFVYRRFMSWKRTARGAVL